MGKNGYIVTRSNYTLKKKRQTTKQGNIYERDYMTTSSLGSWSSDVFPYGDSNFKMVTRLTNNEIRQHSFGDWLQNSSCNNNVWTLKCLSENKNEDNYIETDSTIKLKPNYGSMLDFAYYGSCIELLKASVNNIIRYYPAELFITDSNIDEYFDENYVNGPDKDNGKTFKLGHGIYKEIQNLKKKNIIDKDINIISSNFQSEDYAENNLVEVKNLFNIDLTSKIIDYEKDKTTNELRYFCKSANKYDILNENDITIACACNWDVIYKSNPCSDGGLTGIILLNNSFYYDANADNTKSDDGNFIIFEYFLNKEYYYLCDKRFKGLKIRPTQRIIDNYFKSLDSFEKLLLNRNSTPLYTCTIEYPHETENGIEKYNKRFTWPTSNNWNLDIESYAFTEYLDGLLDVATFYDEGYSNNLINNMTHDSIKNMDLTYQRPKSSETQEDYQEGTTKVKSILNVYGRQFDDLKRLIDNIKYINNVTYNEYNNIPDELLTVPLELSGWEVYNPLNGVIDYFAYKIKYGDNIKYFDSNDAKNLFYRTLKLNSKRIFSKKGTRKSIEELLSIFGLKSSDFARLEYERLSDEKKLKENNKILNFEEIKKKYPQNYFDYDINEYVSVASNSEVVKYENDLTIEKYNKMRENYNDEMDTLYGLPCALVTFVKNETTYKYVIPWFDKFADIDGNPYFQMYGGWSKIQKKSINSQLTTLKEIYSATNTIKNDTEVKIYTYLNNFITGLLKNFVVGDTFDFTTNDNEIDYIYCSFNCQKGDKITLINKTYANKYNNIYIIDNNNKVIYKQTLNTVTYNIDLDNAYMCVITISNFNGESEDKIIKHEYSVEYNVDKIDFYDESFKYLKVTRDLDSLIELSSDSFHDNEIFYVHDITKYEEYFNKPLNSYVSHYFILNNKDYSYEYSSEGWCNIPNNDINEGKYNGLKVLYLETIIDNFKGNAPHIGYGKYDDGESYIDIFRNLFKNTIFGDEAYDCKSGEFNDEINNIGFNVIKQKDNMKCWYFTDNEKLEPINANNTYITSYYSELEPFDFENQSLKNSRKEAAANSIINTKKITIDFYSKYCTSTSYQNFINNSVLPYLKQLIPSTALLEINIVGSNAISNKRPAPTIAGMTNDSNILMNKYSTK